MQCERPMLMAPIPGARTKNNKQKYKFLGVVFKYSDSELARIKAPLVSRCKSCVLCRLSYAREWATRVVHQIRTSGSACFVTLTYDEKSLPADGNLCYADHRKFYNDLRGRLAYRGEAKIKYISCGEYGEEKGRPHFHSIVFGRDFRDGAVQVEQSQSGALQFDSPLLSEVWGRGRVRVSEANFDTACYIARYTLKKSYSDNEVAAGRVAEGWRMSNGIGKDWFDQFASTDVYRADNVYVPGKGTWCPPKYYDRLLERADPDLFLRIKLAREENREEVVFDDDFRRAMYNKRLFSAYKGLEAKSRKRSL